MSIPNTIKMTANQYVQLGEDPPGTRLELVDGEIAVCRGKTLPHARVDMRLCYQLLNHVIDKNLGEILGNIDIVLGEFDVRRPDIIFYAKSRENLINYREVLRLIPDLVVEVTSEHTDETDRVIKFEQYAKVAIPFYWIVDSDLNTIEAFRLADGRYESAGAARGSETIKLPPFEDLTIDLGDLWWPR